MLVDNCSYAFYAIIMEFINNSVYCIFRLEGVNMKNLSKAVLVGISFSLFYYLIKDFNLNFIWKFAIGMIIYLVINLLVDKGFKKEEVKQRG